MRDSYTKLKQFIIDNNYPSAKALVKTKEYKPIIEEMENATRFLDERYNKVVLTLRIYCIMNDIFELNECGYSSCTKTVAVKKVRGSEDQYEYKFSDYCSSACSLKTGKPSQKARETLLKRYGADNTMEIPQSRKKRDETLLKRYGSIDIFSTEHFREKATETWVKKYGYDNPAKAQSVKDKKIQTNLDNRGVVNPMQCSTITENRNKKHFELYGVYNPFQREDVKDKIRESNIERWGHVNYNSSLITEDSQCILDDKGKLSEFYEKYRNTDIISRMLDVSQTTVINYMVKHNIDRAESQNVSGYEIEIRDMLDKHDIKYKASDRRLLIDKEVDILIEDYKLAIEFNGLYWHSDKFRDKKYHQDKTFRLHKLGYNVIHIWEDYWVDDTKRSIIINKILRHCRKLNTKTVYGRQCSVKTVSSKDSSIFYNHNHIQGNVNSSINIGLYSKENELVGCMSFKYMRGGVFDLTRYATKCNLPGGFSKLLSYFTKNYTWKEIYTFASLDYSKGNMYSKCGFELEGITPPNYFYYKRGKRYTRHSLMKHRMKDVLDNFDDNLTEYQNAYNNGYRRVYDSGSLKFRMIND